MIFNGLFLGDCWEKLRDCWDAHPEYPTFNSLQMAIHGNSKVSCLYMRNYYIAMWNCQKVNSSEQFPVVTVHVLFEATEINTLWKLSDSVGVTCVTHRSKVLKAHCHGQVALISNRWPGPQWKRFWVDSLGQGFNYGIRFCSFGDGKHMVYQWYHWYQWYQWYQCKSALFWLQVGMILTWRIVTHGGIAIQFLKMPIHHRHCPIISPS